MASLPSMWTDEYKASLRQLISTTVEQSVRASFAACDAKRAAEQPTVWESSAALLHESADEMARRRRRRIELVEDRARRDPVWAEKIARRHAAFRDVLTATAAPTSSTSTGGMVPECCCYDLEPAAAASTPTSSRFDMHALAASDPSKRATSMQTTAAADSISAAMGAASIFNDSELALAAPITCSAKCPSRGASYLVVAPSSSATPASSTTTGGVSEPCCFDPEPAAVISTPTSALDLLEGGDDFTSMSPSICSILCQGCGIGTVGSAACSIDLIFARGASTSSLTPATYLLDDVDITKRSENMFPPWPPPWFVSFQDVNMCKDMLQALLLYGLFLQSMQTSGDWHVSKTVELKVWPALLLSIFVPEVQSTLLRATMFKWSYLLGSDIHSLSSSTLDSLLARRAAHIVWKWCCLDNFHGSFGSINWALEEEKGQVLLSMPWPSFRYHRVAAYLILLWKLPTGHSHEDPNGFAGSFVLHWTSFSDENQMHLFTAAETFWCKLFSVGKTGDCLESEHQQQWRPPDQVTLLACMGALFLRFKACLSDGQWALSTGAIFEAEYLEVHNFLYRLTSNHFSTELFVIENWLIPWGPGNDSPGHNLMGHFTSLAITFELLCSISDDDNLLADCYLLWCMSCVQVDRPRNCVSYWRPNPPWSHPAPTNSTSEIVSDLRTVFESLHICDNSFKLDIIGFAAWYMFCAKNIILCTSFHQVRVHPPGMHDMFSIMLMSSASLVFVEVCPSSTEKMQHSVMLEKLKPGLSLELHLLVLVVMRKEAVPWPFFQPTSRDTILLLPWDPGALMYGMCTKYPVEWEQKWMVSLVEQLAIVKFPAMPYTIHHHPPSGDLMVLIAAANSDIVTYLHSRGPPASDEPDCVASKNLVVPNASTSPGFSFTRIRVVVTFPPGLEVGQDSNMLLAVCPVHWKIVWSLVLKCSASGNKAGQPLDTTTVNSEDYFEKKSAVLPPFSPRTVQASLQASAVTFHSSAHVAVCGSCGMNLGVKPKFKEGGMLATFPNIAVGLDHGLPLLGLGLSDGTKGAATYTRGLTAGTSAWNGWLRPPLLLSSSSSLPLFLFCNC